MFPAACRHALPDDFNRSSRSPDDGTWRGLLFASSIARHSNQIPGLLRTHRFMCFYWYMEAWLIRRLRHLFPFDFGNISVPRPGLRPGNPRVPLSLQVANGLYTPLLRGYFPWQTARSFFCSVADRHPAPLVCVKWLDDDGVIWWFPFYHGGGGKMAGPFQDMILKIHTGTQCADRIMWRVTIASSRNSRKWKAFSW